MTNLSPRVIFNFEQIFNRTANRIEFYRFSTAFELMEHKTKKSSKTPIFRWLSENYRHTLRKSDKSVFEKPSKLYVIITELSIFWKLSMKIFVRPAV